MKRKKIEMPLNSFLDDERKGDDLINMLITKKAIK